MKNTFEMIYEAVKLIPAGSGLAVYRDFEEKTDENIAEAVEEYVDLSALVNKTNAL